MLDNVLIKLIIATLIAQEAAIGIPGFPIKQAFQPTQQGVPTAPTAFLHKAPEGDILRGSPERADAWDDVGLRMAHTETQVYETTFKISTLSTQDPANASQLTASDLLNYCRAILQSSQTIASFKSNGVGVLRIGQVQNPAFVDDRERHEFQPTLDVTISHTQTITTYGPPIDHVEEQIIVI